MDIDLILGVILVTVSIGVSTALITFCLRLINKISRRNLSSLREIEKEFGNGR